MTRETIGALGAAGRHFEPGGGYSAIVDPTGEYRVEPVPDYEGLLTAEIDLEEVEIATRSVDSDGHYARPDVLRLVVDRTPQRVIEIEGEATV